MTSLKDGDVFKLNEILKTAAKTGYDYAKVTKTTVTHHLGSFMIEATFEDEPKDKSKVKIIDSSFMGNTYCFRHIDIIY